MTNAESKKRWRARRRGEDVPKLKPWGDTGKGVYKWSDERKVSWTGEGNPNWKGDAVGEEAAHGRAQRWYRLGPCEICGNTRTERHHKDSNPLNNEPENVMILCRRHHMMVDGRRASLIARIIESNKAGPKGKVRMQNDNKSVNAIPDATGHP
jgi:hypothetical protein